MQTFSMVFKVNKLLVKIVKRIAVLVSNNGSNEIDLVYQNENSFIKGERVVFIESNLTANVTKFTEGDKDIANDFIFNPAQYLEYVTIVS